MKKDKKITTLFIFSVAGVLFSGYLSGVKFFAKTCAFGESCPYFLGYPACYFGFAMFLAITLFSSLLLYSKIEEKKGLMGIGSVSLLGIIFAGHFTILELPILFAKGLGAYLLGLPTCALGLIFYIAIFVITIITLKQNTENEK